jgi:hypothetical protein
MPVALVAGGPAVPGRAHAGMARMPLPALPHGMGILIERMPECVIQCNWVDIKAGPSMPGACRRDRAAVAP